VKVLDLRSSALLSEKILSKEYTSLASLGIYKKKGISFKKQLLKEYSVRYWSDVIYIE
jgi:hypothetical protein